MLLFEMLGHATERDVAAADVAGTVAARGFVFRIRKIVALAVALVAVVAHRRFLSGSGDGRLKEPLMRLGGWVSG